MNKELYIGVDLAWSPINVSGISILENNTIVESFVIEGIDKVIDVIKKYPNAIVGVDAPLVVENENGNRKVEIEFLKDYSSKKLGVYPVNRKLLTKYHEVIPGEKLNASISQTLGKDLFEVYPHATIMNCFHGRVLPYKRKKGRDTAFIKTQIKILENYLSEKLNGEFKEDLENLRGLKLKHYEDKLDSLVCAYTLYHCKNYDFNLYEKILKIPMGCR